MFVLYNPSTKQFISQWHRETVNLLDALSFSQERTANNYAGHKDLPDGFIVLHQHEAMVTWLDNTRQEVGVRDDYDFS